MSGLYNVVFGANANSESLVAALQAVAPFDVGRFRDAWVESDGDRVIIRIHTRNGGGNREAYEAEIQSMQDHPWYLRDQDDDYDYTYADFYFLVPAEELTPDLIDAAQPPVDMGAKWDEVIEALKQ